MSDNDPALFDSGGATWNLPAGEASRQAIPALRGYAYQLHLSLAAWIALPVGGELHLEVAEDYAAIASDPSTLDRVLEATQVKDTRESGSVTLNSPDVRDAIRHLWALQEANPERPIRLTFLTTSPVGKERLNPLISGLPALEEWRRAARGGPLDVIRQALADRFPDGELGSFISGAADEPLRKRLLQPLSWSCGAPPLAAIEADNRSALIELGHELRATPDLSARAADVLLAQVLNTIVSPGSKRRLTRGELLNALHEATSIRVPAQALVGAAIGAAADGAVRLTGTGAWHDLASLASSPRARRKDTVEALSTPLKAHGALWIHGATGLGKSVLAELVAGAQGGRWWLLDLRGMPGAAAAERLAAASGAIGAMTAFDGLIIDDIGADLDELEAPLRRLTDALTRRDALTIVTSHNPPSHRLGRAVGVAGDAVVTALSFTETDTAALIAQYCGDPAVWTRFAWLVGGSGHPQLTDVVVAGLASRSWPLDTMSEWMAAGFQFEDVTAEREAARRRLLRELSDQTRQFLYRASRITGPFDRQLALAVGRAPPPVQDAAGSLDLVTGHWIERLGPTLLRTSPLVEGLAAQMLSPEELAVLDREISTHILSRDGIPADLADTAFLHAAMAGAVELVNAIAVSVIRLTGEKRRTALASAMPIFRGASGDPGGMFAKNSNVEVLVRLAQHRLITAVAEPETIARSSARVIARLDAVEDLEARGHLEMMVLSKVLIDQFAFGKIPDWFLLVDRFELACERSDQLADLTASMKADGGPEPVVLAFLAHATQLPSLDTLDALFQHLDHLDGAIRQRRLAPLLKDPTSLSLTIDSPWLKQSNVEVLDGVSQAVTYARLAHMALRWSVPTLAAQCFRAQAIMLDEYAKDPSGALAALGLADQQLPDHLVLRRERAKIAWRAKDYQSALAQLSAIADRLETAEPLETAFALREAAISAGELSLWADAWRFFERARTAADAAAGRPTPFNVGLAGDAAAARFASGDRIGALRDMRLALEALDGVPPSEGLKAHYCHLLLRHIVIWMESAFEEGLRVEGEPAVYVPGSASNPAPMAELAARPLGDLPAAWSLLSGMALTVGVPPAEVISWPGVADLRNYAMFDVTLRMALLSAAIKAGSMELFHTFVQQAVEAMSFLSTQAWRESPPNLMRPERSLIPQLSGTELRTMPALRHWRDAALAMGCGLTLPDRARGTAAIDRLHEDVRNLTGADVVPEWAAGGVPDDDDLASLVAGLIRKLAEGRLTGIEDHYGAELRLAEWAPKTSYGRVVADLLAERVRADWVNILKSQSALLRHPMLNGPAIRAALDAPRNGLDFVANLLLVVESATQISLSEDYRDGLRARLGTSL